MGYSFSTSGPRPNSKYSRGEKIPVTVELIVSTLRPGVYLGEAQNFVICLCCIGDSLILALISETKYTPPRPR